MSLVQEINRYERAAEIAATRCVKELLRGNREGALNMALMSQHLRVEQWEYAATLSIAANTKRAR